MKGQEKGNAVDEFYGIVPEKRKGGVNWFFTRDRERGGKKGSELPR